MKLKTLLKSNFFFLTVIIVFFVFIVLYIASCQYIWMDEAFTLNTTSKSIGNSLSTAISFEGQPPFYFVLLRLWRYINNSIFFARLFSILCIISSIFIVYFISKKHLKNINPLITALLFSFNPIIIWAALEIRVYALIVFLSSLIIMLFLNTYKTSDNSRYSYKRLSYSLIALISIYTQYYLGFLLLTNFIFLIIIKNWSGVKYYFIDMILPVIGIILLIPFLPGQLSIHTHSYNESFYLLDIITFIFRQTKDFLFPLIIIDGINNIWIYILIFLLFLFSFKKNLKNTYQNIIKGKNYFLLSSVLLFIIFSCLYYFIGPTNVKLRHTILIFIPLLSTLIIFISFIPSKKIRTIWVFIFLLVYFVRIITGDCSINNKGKTIKDVSDFIELYENENEPILFYQNDILIVFVLFYNGKNNLAPIPSRINFESSYNRCNWMIKNKAQLDDFFADFSEIKTFWLITSENDTLLNKAIQERWSCDLNYSILNDFIYEKYDVLLKKDFQNRLMLRKIVVK